MKMFLLQTTMSCWVLLSISSVSSSNNQENITAKLGDSATLPCRAAGGKPVLAVEWTRPDLGEECVLLYRDEQIDPFNQHASYKNRVDLKDRQMKDGDVSMVLKNVTTADNGTYHCRVHNEGSFETELIRTIRLDVISGDKDRSEDAVNKDGAVGLILGLIIPVIIVVVAGVLFLIYKNKSACSRKKSPDSPAEL